MEAKWSGLYCFGGALKMVTGDLFDGKSLGSPLMTASPAPDAGVVRATLLAELERLATGAVGRPAAVVLEPMASTSTGADVDKGAGSGEGAEDDATKIGARLVLDDAAGAAAVVAMIGAVLGVGDELGVGTGAEVDDAAW